MALARALHRRGKRLGIDKRIGEALLIGYRQMNDARFVDHPRGRLARGGDDEVGQAAPLDLRRSLEQRMNVDRQPRFEASSGWCTFHASHIRQIAGLCQVARKRPFFGD